MFVPNSIPICDVCGHSILLDKMDISSFPLGPTFPSLVCHAAKDCRKGFDKAKAEFLLGMFCATIKGLEGSQLQATNDKVTEYVKDWQENGLSFKSKIQAVKSRKA